MTNLLNLSQSQLHSLARHDTIWLAYSGGLDSTVLLHLLINSPLRSRVAALHINHQLSPSAKAWQRHCEDVCANYGLRCEVECVDVEAQEGSTESAARELRYGVFELFVTSNDALLTAHHQNDQAETFFYRLFRGAGLAGLASMRPQRDFSQGVLLRPLLQFQRAELERYARENALSWVEDDSNTNTEFDRNYLRNSVMPLIEKRWPRSVEKISQTVGWLAEADSLLSEYAAEDLELCVEREERGGHSIAIPRLEKFSDIRLKNVIRHWCKVHFVFSPQAAQMAKLNEVLLAREDASPCLDLGACQLRRFKRRLYLLASVKKVDQLPLSWRGDAPLELADGSILSVDGVIADALTVRTRKGGERCRPLGRGHSQTLKKLLQEYQVEPWLRDRVPLVYCDDELVAVAGVFLCESQLVAKNPSVRFRWQEKKAV